MTNKIIEYLKLLPKGITNPLQIAEGWKNSALAHLKSLGINTLSDEEYEEIVRRRVICDGCPYNSINARTSKEYKELTGTNLKTSRTDVFCSLCECPLVSKTSCFTCECGVSEWNLKNQNRKIPLKWGVWKSNKN